MFYSFVNTGIIKRNKTKGKSFFMVIICKRNPLKVLCHYEEQNWQPSLLLSILRRGNPEYL